MEVRIAQTHRHTHVPVERKIRFWMRVPVVTVNVSASISEALMCMQEHNVRRLPVVSDAGEVCGMITHGDIRGADVLQFAGIDLATIADALRHIRVGDVMGENLIAITPETDLREAALLMIDGKVGGLPVVDDTRVVVGIITESDLFEALLQQLDSVAR